MKKITTLVLLSCLMSLRSFADVIWQETFNYTNGSIALTSTNGNPPGLTNWLTHSGSSDNFVNNKRLEVSTSSANGGVTVTRSGDINRQFSITNSSVITNAHQLVYASFIVNFTNLPTTNGAYFAHFKAGLPSSGTFQGRLWALIGGPLQTTNNFTALPKTFRLGVSASGSGSPSKTLGLDLALNTDYQVIMGWDPVTLFAVTMWVNPVSSSDASATSSDAFAPTAANIANSFAFRQASGFGGFLTVSNLVCATTFDEALTNGRPTNAVAPSIVYQPVGVTNFVNSVIALSAVANGQGQAGLTYSWFRSNSVTGFQPFANPAGNTNVLAFASAQTTDTGHYQLAVTTPYGLSVTSTPVSVLISAVPVPPSFVIQPGSQTLFRGQNLTLTTTVSSPGNCTFTWFSNNVVVLTTGPDNTGTSSYTLNNVVTNDSATYKVAVTNDVVLTGIVSTNAVVTVINPPHVSIAFLRSLVDPNANYSATNSTQPYEVTGVVTTYTNITSGNTASYYLQDATAGINIFATFGSTFRPLQGDVVTFVGVTSSFSSGLELFADTVNRPYTSYSIVSNNFALPTPLSIPFTITNNNYSNMNYSIAGRLVQLTNVFFGANTGSNIAGGFIPVTNGLGQTFSLWFPGVVDGDTFGRTLPDYAKTVTGVMFGGMNGGTPNFAVAVTKFSDIVTNPAIVSPIPLNMAVAGSSLTFSWTDGTFTLQTATNLVGPWTGVMGATSPFMTNVTSDPVIFYRLFHP